MLFCTSIEIKNPIIITSFLLFQYNVDSKTCSAIGSLDVATFEPNPFKDGMYIQ